MTWQAVNWIFLAGAAWIVTIVVVRVQRIKELSGVALWGGIILTIFVQILGVHIFNWWEFRYDYFTIIGIPFSLVAAWTAEVILFANYMPERPSWQALYILSFAFATTMTNVYFVINGLQILTRWNLFYTFLLALVIHSFIAYVIMPLTRNEIIRNY